MPHAPSTAVLPKWLWLYPPLIWAPMQFAISALDDERSFYAPLFEGEMGLVELLTAALLAPAAGMAFVSARRLARAANRAPAALLALLGFGCLFLMAEEISYGQHFLHWKSPEYFQEVNVQSETNLHNLSYVNKSLPKWALVIGMAVGGVLAPLIARWASTPTILRARWIAPLMPVGACLPTAAVALVAHLAVKVLAKQLNFGFHDDFGVALHETVELYISFFLFLYTLGVWRTVAPPGSSVALHPSSRATNLGARSERT